jgi:DNA-binding response OmpR family regulator
MNPGHPTNAIEDEEAQRRKRAVRCVLLAEDDYEFRRLLTTAFRRWGYEVIEARDANELNALIRSHLFDPHVPAVVDLLVSDIRMPGGTGLLALAELRERNWSTPVVLMSAFSDAVAHAEALRLGATLLDKPFPLSTLHDLVGELEPST